MGKIIEYFFFGSFLGLFTGWAAIKLMSRFLTKKTQVYKEDTAKIEAETSKILDAKERLNKVQELTQLQLELLGQIDAPSANSLHSRYKNSLGSRVQELEEEKIEILKSIVADGIDPIITTSSSSGTESLKLSDYLKEVGVDVDALLGKTPDPAVPPQSELNPGALGAPRKVGNFVVYQGGKGETSN